MSLTNTGSMLGVKEQEQSFKNNSVLPKTASSINQNRTEKMIGSNKTIDTAEALTQK